MTHRPRFGLAGAAALAAVAAASFGCGRAPSTATEIPLPAFASLEAARTHAAEVGAPVLLDFYTDW